MKKKINLKMVHKKNVISGFVVDGWRAKYHSGMNVPEDETTKKIQVKINGDMEKWFIEHKKVSGLSVDFKNKKLLVMQEGSFHEAMEHAAGYKGTASNDAHLVRISKIPKSNEYRIYTYGHVRGTAFDAYPNQSARALEWLLKNGILTKNYNVRIYFNVLGEGDASGTLHKAEKSLFILKVAGKRYR